MFVYRGPSRQAANMLVISSTRLGSMIASTSPRRSPASASRAATTDTVLGEVRVVEFLALVGDAGPCGIPRGPFVGNGGCEHGGTFRAVRVLCCPEATVDVTSRHWTHVTKPTPLVVPGAHSRDLAGRRLFF